MKKSKEPQLQIITDMMERINKSSFLETHKRVRQICEKQREIILNSNLPDIIKKIQSDIKTARNLSMSLIIDGTSLRELAHYTPKDQSLIIREVIREEISKLKSDNKQIEILVDAEGNIYLDDETFLMHDGGLEIIRLLSGFNSGVKTEDLLRINKIYTSTDSLRKGIKKLTQR